MRMTLAAVAMAGFCLILMEASQAQAQSSARCGNFYNQVTAAVSRSDRAALERLLGLPASQQCLPEAQTARGALARLAAPPPVVPPVTPPVAPPVSPPARQVSPPPVVRADPAAEEAAAWRISSRTDTVAAYNAYLADYPNGRNAAAARQRIAALTPRASPPPPPPITSLDARTTPASTRAPLVTNPSSLPDFALFRECDGCPEMVVLPSGSFQMGSPAGESGRSEDEDTQAGAGGGTLRVNIRRFAISRFETTWDQWTACVNAGACNQGAVDGAGGDNGWGRGSRPIIEVDWNDAAAYAIFVGGRARAASAYRLPTEAEWEYAARAGTSTRWSFGDTESQLGAYAWFSSNSSSRTQPVGGKLASPWGLFEMHGNVWEWVEDCYNESYAATPQNGAANTTGGCSDRVIRGGSWYFYPQVLRSAFRFRNTPTGRDDSIGFRLSRTL
jgi:formylglycine-generating enzyme required for sulfatase activity